MVFADPSMLRDWKLHTEFKLEYFTWHLRLYKCIALIFEWWWHLQLITHTNILQCMIFIPKVLGLCTRKLYLVTTESTLQKYLFAYVLCYSPGCLCYVKLLMITYFTEFVVAGHILVTGSSDHTVRIWELRTYKCLHIINILSDAITAVKIHVTTRPMRDLIWIYCLKYKWKKLCSVSLFLRHTHTHTGVSGYRYLTLDDAFSGWCFRYWLCW